MRVTSSKLNQKNDRRSLAHSSRTTTKPLNPIAKLFASAFRVALLDTGAVEGVELPVEAGVPVVTEPLLDPDETPVTTDAGVEVDGDAPDGCAVPLGPTIETTNPVEAALVPEAFAPEEVLVESTDKLVAAEFAEPTLLAVRLCDATAEVTRAVAAFCQTDTTHCDAILLSTNFPFCFEGVRLKV